MGSNPLFTDGVIVVDKPAGPTSHDVVAVMRRTLIRNGRVGGKPGKPKVGHTTTLDRGGDVVAREHQRPAADLTLRIIEEAVAEFRGTYLQQPPVFSAKKINGDRAYDLARRNAPVRLQPVQVTAT